MTEDEPLSIRLGRNEIQIFFDDIAVSAEFPRAEDLASIAGGFGAKHWYGETVEENSGPCAVGSMGTTVFRSDECPRIQVWLLCGSRRLVYVIHVCRDVPTNEEIAEAAQIVQAFS
jgi:hypothetical protein